MSGVTREIQMSKYKKYLVQRLSQQSKNEKEEIRMTLTSFKDGRYRNNEISKGNVFLMKREGGNDEKQMGGAVECDKRDTGE